MSYALPLQEEIQDKIIVGYSSKAQLKIWVAKARYDTFYKKATQHSAPRCWGLPVGRAQIPSSFLRLTIFLAGRLRQGPRDGAGSP